MSVFLPLTQRKHRYRSEVFYVPGKANTLADVASRRFDLTDSQLVSLFNRIAPQHVHGSALPLTRTFAAQMVHHGDFTLLTARMSCDDAETIVNTEFD